SFHFPPPPAPPPLPLHDALPICPRLGQLASRQPSGLRAERRSLREDKRRRGSAGRGGRPGGHRVEELADRQLGIAGLAAAHVGRSEEHTSELQSLTNLVCRLLLE